MNVGILGSGDVARALAAGFLERGDAVMLGTRDPHKLDDWRAAGGARAHVGSFAQAAAFGELIVLATLGTATVGIVAEIAPAAFAAKVVIDATNPLRFEPGKPPQLAIGFSDSLGEQVQRALAGAHVVKAFNTVGSALMVHPRLRGGPPDMFLAGNDAAAKARVGAIVEAFGWNPVDLGDIAASRYLEPLCMAWLARGLQTGNWSFAYKFLTP